jgi:hypothetical protein
LGRASSGRKAAISDSPYEKKALDRMTNTTAHTMSPGPALASAAVASTQPTVDSTSSRFLAARRSA